MGGVSNKAKLEAIRNLNLCPLHGENPLRSFRLEDHFEATVIIQVKDHKACSRLWSQRCKEVDVYVVFFWRWRGSDPDSFSMYFIIPLLYDEIYPLPDATLSKSPRPEKNLGFLNTTNY